MSKELTDSDRPAGLGERGGELWTAIAGAYSLRPDEARMLVDVCFEADLIERIQLELIGAPLTVKGSYGQVVANPLLSEIRQHRAVVASLLGKLKLPDTPEGELRKHAATSEAARKAARARWGNRGGGA